MKDFASADSRGMLRANVISHAVGMVMEWCECDASRAYSILRELADGDADLIYSAAVLVIQQHRV